MNALGFWTVQHITLSRNNYSNELNNNYCGLIYVAPFFPIRSHVLNDCLLFFLSLYFSLTNRIVLIACQIRSGEKETEQHTNQLNIHYSLSRWSCYLRSHYLDENITMIEATWKKGKMLSQLFSCTKKIHSCKEITRRGENHRFRGGVCAHIQGQKLCVCDAESKRAYEQTKNKNLSGRQNG